MKGLVAGGLAVGLAVAVIGTAILGSAASLLGVCVGGPGSIFSSDSADPDSDADALPAGGSHVPILLIDRLPWSHGSRW